MDVELNQNADFTYLGKEQLSEKQQELRKLWNEGGIQGKMQFAKGMKQIYKGDNEAQAIFDELYKKLKEYRDAAKNLKAFERYGTTDPNDLIRKINEEAKTEKKQDVQTETKINSLNQQQELKKEQSQFKSLDTDAQRIQFYQQKLNKEKEIGLELQKKTAEALEKRNTKAKQYNEIIKKLNSGKLNDQQKLEVSKKALDTLKQLNSLNAQHNNITVQLTENTGKQLQLQLAIKQLKQKSSDYYASSLKALNAEIQVTKLKLKGLNEEAEKQQLINELKLKGLMVDEAEVDKILAKRRELAKLNKQLENNNKNYFVDGSNLRDKIQQNLNPKGYEYKKRLAQEQKKKGSALTKSEKAKLSKVISLEFKANELFGMTPNMQGLQTMTNELAARGGFASSVVESSTRDVNQRIYQTQKSAESQLKSILAEMKKLGVIQ